MNRRSFLGLAATGGLGAAFSAPAAGAARQPNFIFIFCDDLGWADLPCHGHQPLKAHGGWTMREKLEMPNIDRMAREGTVFTRFYVNSAVCSPSRTGCLTGRFPSELGIHDYLARHDLNVERGMPDWVDPSVPTIPSVLRGVGYATGHFGKWHLCGGGLDNAPSPEEYGIDRYAACLDGPDGRPGSTEMIADETISFIRKNSDRPFCVNAWLYDPHSPLRPLDKHLAPYSDLSPKWDGHLGALQVWYAVLTEIDRNVGRIIDTLDELGLSGDTYVIFSSDNGPESGLMTFTSHYGGASSTNTGPFRGIKRSLYEGGIREPFIVRRPGTTPAGEVNNEAVLSGVDLLPTFAALAGAEIPAGLEPDGEDVSAALRGRRFTRHRPLYWENRFPVYGHVLHKSPMLGVSDGRWKLLMNPDGSRVELYDIPADPSELNNLAPHKPDKVAELRAMLLDWQTTLPPGPVHPDAGSNAYPWPDR